MIDLALFKDSFEILFFCFFSSTSVAIRGAKVAYGGDQLKNLSLYLFGGKEKKAIFALRI
jgi:hypothetical protein